MQQGSTNKITFHEYLKKLGPEKISLKFDVDISTVYNWANGRNCPEPMTAYRIVQDTDGVITYDDIYTPFFKTKFKAKY